MLQVEDQVVRHVRVGGQDVAYSIVGRGRPLVVGGWWCSHLVLNWEDPAFRDYVSRLAEHHQVVRYDRPGSGASSPDGEPPTDLEAEVDVVAGLLDALAMDKVDLVGASSGAALAVGLATRRPAQVDHVVLYGAFARGADIAPESARTAMLDTIGAHWGLGSRLLADVFVPGASSAERERFAAFQRASASRLQAREALAATYRIDATAHLSALRRPTTVLHRRDDRAVPFELGVDVSRQVRGATFVALGGEDHFPWRGDAAAVADATLRGLGHRVAKRPTVPGPAALTARELEVLRLVGEGLTDVQIGDRLVVSPHTVHRHVANARVKLGVRSRAAAAAAVHGLDSGSRR